MLLCFNLSFFNIIFIELLLSFMFLVVFDSVDITKNFSHIHWDV